MEMMPQIRRMYLTGEIKEGSLVNLIEKIIAVNKEEEEYDRFYEEEAKKVVESIVIHKLVPTDTGQIGITMKRPPVEPIELYINCTGGLVDEGLAFINAIKESKVPIIAYVSHSASMGTVIALSCDKVITYPTTTFMIHQLSYGITTTLNNQEEQIKKAKLQQKDLDKIILDNSEIPVDELQKHYDSGKDWVLRGDDIRDYGLTNRIIQCNKHRDTTFEM